MRIDQTLKKPILTSTLIRRKKSSNYHRKDTCFHDVTLIGVFTLNNSPDVYCLEDCRFIRARMKYPGEITKIEKIEAEKCMTRKF